MIAVIKKAEEGYTARYERNLQHSVEKVWAGLTENDKLAKWFSELEVDSLRKGGTIKFNMPDETFIGLEIIELTLNSVLEFTWDEGIVRFELYPEPEGCCLILIEKMAKITDHTPRDLAGWHVCLAVLGLLLDGKTLESRENEWKIQFELYKELIDNLNKN
ncbi:SRPBCC family protein [Paenibacillus psychroresistens]|uniref:SRPBCC family protein n=1 Tax=Paenibacillus psychroresistens TaxID=1778678 RepID=A0A6B8RA62_9BACL|nr:SRPBCC family protein [Paenibacillus psychroresistens]QGQ93559.1 SRPBCC family protein [Paenibacillus psychroresistens]